MQLCRGSELRKSSTQGKRVGEGKDLIVYKGFKGTASAKSWTLSPDGAEMPCASAFESTEILVSGD